MKKSTKFIIYFIFLLPLFGIAQTANWSPILPTKFPVNASGQINGISRVSQLKFHPTNSNKLYAVSARGGLFISTDAGTNWTVTPGTDNLPSMRLASVCIDFTNDQILYLGTGDHNYYYNGSGVWKSTDGGTTFAQTTLTNKLVIDMIMDPLDHNTLVAITNAGIYKTTNAGTTWTLKSTSRTFDDLKQRTPNSRVLFAATTDSAFFRSTDFGDNWTQITNGIVLPSGVTNGNGCRIAVTPADTNVVYLAMVANSGLIYKSVDAGLTFSAIKTTVPPYLTYYSNASNSSGQGDYNFGIGADRVNANILYFVAHNIWKSTDGGATWTQLTNWYATVHTDMHQIIISPYNNSLLYDANDGGIWLSTDAGSTWATKCDGINGYEIYHGNCSPTSKATISIGTQDNGELYSTAANWLTNRGGDWSSQCAFDYRSNSTMVYYYQNNKRRLVTGGDVTYGLPAQVTLLHDIAFHRSNPDLAFVADTIIYRTKNLTATTPTWTQIATFNKKVMAMHCSLADTNRLYIITNDAFIYVSSNALSASPTFTSYALPSSTNSAAKITTIKSSANIVYVTCNNKVYRSSDGGATWTNITYNLPTTNHVAILSDEYFTSNELVFVATFNTVYYKTVNATSWTIYNTNLPTRTDAIDLSIYNDGTSNTALRFATYGRGMWETSISNLRALTANFTVDNTNPCSGVAVQFNDLSTGSVTTRNWTFTGGTPATSTLQNPTVIYNSSGTYNVSLTVGDGTTTNTLTQTNYVSTVGGSLNLTEGFEGTVDPPSGWKNIDNGTIGDAWVKTGSAGGYGTSGNSMMFDNYSWNISGQKDELQVKRLNFYGYTAVKLYFDIAYQVFTGYSDSLAVLVSSDCGATFTRVYIKGGSTLSTAGSGGNNFVPTAAQWRTDTINLLSYIGQQNIIVEFENINGYGNKLYIDNINIIGTACVSASTPSISASSNPVCSGFSTTLSIASGNLNNSSSWKWYATSCGGTLAGTGTSVAVSPTTATNYYARGEGGCAAANGSCGSISVTVNNCTLSLNLKALLQGFYLSNGMMAPVLYNNGLSTDPTACDNITVELHDNTAAHTLVTSQTGVLHTNGVVTLLIPVSSITIGSYYYIVVKHRNSIETWSKNAILFNSLTMNYNFTP